jgi:D-tyrosyl-tRNA(Tyr) deacylase
MRAVIQRVSRGQVEVDGQIVGRVERGLLVYLGIDRDDGPDDLARIARKIPAMRIFPDSSGKMNLDVVQAGGGVLVVSNFTLLGDVSKGRRPAFVAAADPAVAEPMYEQLCALLRDVGLDVQTGRFGAKMSVTATNDGPINLVIDSKQAS